MNHTAKIDLTLSNAIDDDVMDEMENNEATGMFEYKPEPEHLTDTQILDETFLDEVEDFDATEILDEQFSFNATED